MTLVLDIQAQTLSDGKRSVHLTPQMARIVAILSRGVSSIEDLTRALYPNPDDEPGDPSNVISATVCFLRRRCRDAGLKIDIKTLWGHGFRLVSNVEIVETVAPIVIPAEFQNALRSICYGSTHPAADRILELIGG